MLNRLLILLIGIAFVGCSRVNENKNENGLESKSIIIDTEQDVKKILKSTEVLDSLIEELGSKKLLDDSLVSIIKEAENKQ